MQALKALLVGAGINCWHAGRPPAFLGSHSLLPALDGPQECGQPVKGENKEVLLLHSGTCFYGFNRGATKTRQQQTKADSTQGFYPITAIKGPRAVGTHWEVCNGPLVGNEAALPLSTCRTTSCLSGSLLQACLGDAWACRPACSSGPKEKLPFPTSLPPLLHGHPTRPRVTQGQQLKSCS